MTETENTLRTATINGVPVAEHACDGFDCELCVDADRDAAGARLEAYRVAKFEKPVRRRSAVLSARPVATINVRHVSGDIPSSGSRPLGQTAADDQRAARVALDQREASSATGDGSQSATPLQQPLADFVAAPAHLSDVTVAKGFILAGNAVFTVRSQKTGVRYTYKVTRADCSRCGRTDCQCWANPTYFVALLTGPDNVGDYTYLGMLRDAAFRLTRASKMKANSKPVLAFGWVWAALATGRYPALTEIWHEGRCGRCNRPLTVPSSIANGIGPVCAEKGGL